MVGCHCMHGVKSVILCLSDALNLDPHPSGRLGFETAARCWGFGDVLPVSSSDKSSAEISLRSTHSDIGLVHLCKVRHIRQIHVVLDHLF